MTSELSPNKKALLKIRELKQQLAAAETRTDEPIAIVSMACRFPRRSATPELFWHSLLDGADQVSEIPEDRWDLEAFHDDDPDVPGKMYARRGVFLEGLDEMDPEFFGISPREATWVDPQQRMLMEVGWEAIERAGWIPADIGEHTGVFVGWMHNDYQNEASDSFLNLNPYIATGAAGSFLSGRLAYYLGLQGPSVAVDTACSSSLVALHVAISSLQRRDCDRALVGGVNAICSPTTNILTCKLKALSPHGHSRAFDAAADGYLRGEGCGVIALRRLSDAQRGHDPILAVIQGSSVGHNGFSSGLTAPNPKSQEKVIRQALARARVEPADVSYLEAHGTGTELGDPIEMQAAVAALTPHRTDKNPLLVGSVKTNIGHLEAAAGMAGLIKVLLAMQHDVIPGQLHFENPNPHIPWDAIPVKVLTEPTPWPKEKRIAGVSAFGMSGTNAHVVLEKPVANSKTVSSRGVAIAGEGEPEQRRQAARLITISAQDDEPLFALAEGYAESLAQEDCSLEDVAYTTNVARSHLERRAAVVAKEKSEAIERLRSLSRLDSRNGVYRGSARRTVRVAWQFTGQGAQFTGMGQELYDSQPVFRSAIDQCDAWLREVREGSLLEVLFQDGEQIHGTYWTQSAIFALQMGLVKLLEAWGLAPSIVLGHSVGQYAAACVAGIMSWHDGLRLLAERGRLIGGLPTGGKMLAVFASSTQVAQALEAYPDLSIAAMNGTHTVISGNADSIDAAMLALSEQQVRCKPLVTSHAFHSERMDPILDEFERFADQVAFQSAKLPLVCNVSGKVLPVDASLNGRYWANHIRQAVQYQQSIQTAAETGCDLVLEVGPRAVLTRMAAAVWDGKPDTLISCLEHESPDNLSLLKALGQLYVQGVDPDFKSLHGNDPRSPRLLPTYPFQRRRFWGPAKPRAFHAEYHTAHPLLGSKLQLAGVSGETRYESFIEPDSPSWLPDHEVMNSPVLPGAAFVEMAIELAKAAGRSIRDVRFEQPLRPTGRTALQTVVKQQSTAEATAAAASNGDRLSDADLVEAFSSPANANQWNRNFSAKLTSATPIEQSALDREHVLGGLTETAAPSEFYAKMASLGLNYGPKFQTIQSLHFSESEVLAQLKADGDIRGFNIPPTILDGALHALAVGLLRGDDDNLFLPVSIGEIHFVQGVEGEAWCHARWKETEGKTRLADLTLYTAAGEVAMVLSNLQVQEISLAAARQLSGAGAERLLHAFKWTPLRLPAPMSEPTRWLLISTGRSAMSLAEKTEQTLKARGHAVDCVQLNGEGTFADVDPTPFDGITWFLHGSEEDESQRDLQHVVNFVQSLLASGHRQIRCGMQLVTTGAIVTSPELVGENAEATDAMQTQFWGLGRVIGAEQPGYRMRLVDVDGADASADLLADVMLTETVDNQFALRGRRTLVPRLHRLERQRGSVHYSAGCFLVTGGLGSLGRCVAKWLADKGATQIVLVSRREPDETALAFIEEVRCEECDVRVHLADMSDRRDVEKLFARFGTELEPLAGVVHAAGLLDDGLIESQTWPRFEKVLAPKVTAARLLHEYTKDLNLQLFALYSSVASVLGSPGQANYATGNAYLDGLAWQRRQLGLPAISINWGPWAEGMADDERIAKRLALQGITPLGVDEAHAAMEQLLLSGVAQGTIIDADWRRMRLGGGGETPAFLQDLAGAKQRSRGGDSALVTKLKSLPSGTQRDLLVKTIQGSLQGILSTPDAPETDRPLIEMGLDSLMAVEFGTELQQMLGDQFNVGPTMLFDHPTIDAISDHVLELIMSTDPEGEQPPSDARDGASEPLPPGPSTREDIAIIGMSCRFPGAENVEAFWRNLLNGVDAVRDIPEDRWDIARFYSEEREAGKMYTRRGGFLEDIGHFDPAFFNISEQEACWIDPQHRMLLENTFHALEDAGVTTQPLADANVGVFMGIMGQDYAFLPSLEDADVIRGFQGAGLSHSAGVGRISYVFGFEGPSIAIDTASSSSLVAVLEGVRGLQNGDCNLALAGGVNAILAPVNSLLMSKAGLLSPDGRCKSFSAEANGFGRGEGCGVVVLKRLSEAQRDGDRILAVLRGGAVVHNGFSGGITSPNSKAQSRVIDAALKDARVAPSEVQYLEAHGTGTEYGDPMELGAAVSVYGKGRTPDKPLLVGSVKANISHLEAAGGASGLIKTILAIHHGVIPPQIHFDEPSPHIPWKRMPIKMVDQPMSWPEGEERLAGVTALGLVGTNAHVILASPPPVEPTHSPSTEDDFPGRARQVLALSARSQAALRQLAANYLDYLARHAESDGLSLTDVAFTAGVGRRHFENRLALVVDSVSDAVQQLTRFTSDVRGKRNGHGPPGSHEEATSSGQSGGMIDCHSIVSGFAKSTPRLAWFFDDSADVTAVQQLRELYQSEQVVRDLISELDERLAGQGSTTEIPRLQSWIRDEEKPPAPAIAHFLVQASLAKLMHAWNLEPDLVCGLGVGQYAAYCAAGGLGYGDAFLLVCEHLRNQVCDVPDWDGFETLADKFNFYPPSLPMVCSVSGKVIPVHRSLGGSFWREFGEHDLKSNDTLECFLQEGMDVVVQVGGASTQLQTAWNSAKKGMPETVEDVTVVSCLDNEARSSDSLLAMVGELYVRGVTPCFRSLFAGQFGHRISLPTYPYQKKRYWITEISKHMKSAEAGKATINSI